MAIDLKDVAKKIAAIRAQSGQDLIDVAEGTGIAPARLDQIENGHVKPTGDEILVLADYWKRDFQFFISGEIKSDPLEQINALYRSSHKEFSTKDRKAIAEFLYLCETESFLMQELQYSSKKFLFQPSGNHFKSQGEACALAFRKFLGYEGIGKSSNVGMNVYDDAREIGIHVFRRKLENPKISGLFVLHPQAGPCILVNYTEDIYRQRFTVAHELAHAILDAEEKALVSFDGNKDFVELRANRFASCYLVPPAMLKQINIINWDENSVLDWSKKFRVNCAVLGLALKDLKKIDEKTYKRVSSYKISSAEKVDPELPVEFFSKSYDRKKFFLERGLSDFYVNLCFNASYEGIISRGRLAEALLTDEVGLRVIADIYGVTIK